MPLGSCESRSGDSLDELWSSFKRPLFSMIVAPELKCFSGEAEVLIRPASRVDKLDFIRRRGSTSSEHDERERARRTSIPTYPFHGGDSSSGLASQREVGVIS